ncbi:MAG: ATP-binding protein [Cyanobacteria bacterium P01_A01_bin.114]
MTVSASDLSLASAFQAGSSPVVSSRATPRGFKAVVQSTIDFLLVHEIAATIWAKLPKDLAWWEDIRRYRSAQTASQLYCLGPSGLTAAESCRGVEQVTPIPAGIRGEYFVLILADGLVYTLLAQRQPESTEGKRELRVLGALDLQVAQSFKQILRQIVEFADTDGDFTALLSHWDTAVSLPQSRIDSMQWVDAFFNWQLQTQMRSFQEIARYRKQSPDEQSSDERPPDERLLNERPPDATETVPEGSVHQGAPSDMSAPPLLPDTAKNLIQTAKQELRTPLTTIKTALTLLNSPMIKAGQRQRYLDMISSECDRQSTLVNSVFELLQLHNRPYQADLQPLSLADLVPGIVSTYQPLAKERDIMLAYTIPNDLPQVGGVEAWLKQVLINLLSNSIQFTESGGRVWVTAEPRSDKFIALRIKDTGLGITAAELPLVFDAFYRGSAATTQGVRGAGLGLTVARQLLTQGNGTLSIESTPAEGTLLTMLLPVWQAAES